MQAKAVKRQRSPKYPTKLQVLDNRRLLEKHMPAAWRSCAEMAGAISIMLTANSCLGQQPHPGQHKTSAIVAPIFEHGEGRGATGCVVVNAPVFLSEQDAMQVIREELRKSGVVLSETNSKLDDVTIPQKEEEWLTENNKLNIRQKATGGQKPLVLQGFDPKKKVGVAVVEYSDYFDLGGARSHSTVQGYDFKEIAKDVRKRASESGRDFYMGTFYDPTAAREGRGGDGDFYKKVQPLYDEIEKTKDPAVKEQKQKQIEAMWEEHLNPLKDSSRRMLRMQVKDFVDWLKGQGVI